MSIFITLTPWYLMNSNNHKALFLNICSTLSKRTQAWTRNFRLTPSPYHLVSSNQCPKLSGRYLLTLQGEGNQVSWLAPSLASVSLSDPSLPGCLQCRLLQCFLLKLDRQGLLPISAGCICPLPPLECLSHWSVLPCIQRRLQNASKVTCVRMCWGSWVAGEHIENFGSFHVCLSLCLLAGCSSLCYLGCLESLHTHTHTHSTYLCVHRNTYISVYHIPICACVSLCHLFFTGSPCHLSLTAPNHTLGNELLWLSPFRRGCWDEIRSFFFLFKKYLYLFILSCQILVAAHRIFSGSMQTLSCGLQGIIPLPGIETGPPTLET